MLKTLEKRTQLKNDKEIRYLHRIFPNKIENLGKVNLLCGGNGVGKTSLLNAIRYSEMRSPDIDKDKPHMLYYYSNSENNYRNVEPSPLATNENYVGEMVGRYEAHSLSEGQAMEYSINDLFCALDFLKEEKDTYKIVLIDELDSGMSVDKIKKVMNKIKAISEEDEEMQFFISFNNYYCATFFPNDIINMYDGSKIKFNSFEEYVDFICDWKNVKQIEDKTKWLKENGYR